MTASGRVLVLATATLLAAAGAPAGAQFGNLLKKTLPKPPAAAAPPAPVFCSGITDRHLDQLLKAAEARRRIEEEAQRHDDRAKAIRAKAEQAAGARLTAKRERYDACQQAAIAKDPRTKEADRLGELRNRAQDRGDEATADKLGEQFAALTEAVEKDATTKCIDQACLARERAKSPAQELLAEARAAAAKASTPEQKSMFESQIPGYLGMIETEAILKCIGGAEDVTMTPADQAETDAALAAAANVRESADETAAKEAGLTGKEYGKLFECVCGGLNYPAGTPLASESKDVIEARRDELAAALKKFKVC